MVQNRGPTRTWLICEFTAIYILCPLFMYAFRSSMGRFVIPILVITGVACWLVLRGDDQFRRRQLWNREEWGVRMRPILLRFAIGAVIGHEIGHGFDDQGRRFDEKGRIRDWWTATADERFKVKTDALGGQYDSYEPVEGLNINGELTIRNAPDGGLMTTIEIKHNENN